jgi:hypothetical protein
MSAARTDLAVRRAQLLCEAADQRAALQATFTRLQQPLALFDMAWAVGHFVRVHPLAVSGGGALLGMLWRGPLTRLVSRLRGVRRDPH